MPHEAGIPFLREVVIFLAIAAILVPLAQRFRVSPVLGFLLAGILVGPNGLGDWTDELPWLHFVTISDVESVAVLGEFGIVFLLFLIGLELSFERLWSLRRLVLGLGSAQVLVTGTVIGGIALAWGNGVDAAILIGASFALSSTAVVIAELVQRRELSTRVGRASFSVLLLQDMAVVPILILAGAFGDAGDSGVLEALAIGFGVAAGAAIAIYLLGRVVLRPLFSLAASAHAPEFFVAITLLTAIAASAATAAAGLSLALGAFLAGLLLSETEFRHQIEVDIQPFKGLLMGLFFITIGMGIDFRALFESAGLIVLSVIGLIAIKATVITILGRLFSLPLSCSIHSGLLLGQAGEFGLLVVSLAMASGILDPGVGQFMLIVAALSMMLTPGLAFLGAQVSTRMERKETNRSLAPDPEEIAEMGNHVVIAGFGRVGHAVAEILSEEKINYVALDMDIQRVSAHRAHGDPVFFGNGGRVDVLEKVDADRASAIVLTIDRAEEAEQAVRAIRKRWPELPVYARSRDVEHAYRLENAGATRTIPELAESSLQMGAMVLAGLGVPGDAVNTVCARIRERHYEGL